jgi:nicotinamide-nucleotide amidase
MRDNRDLAAALLEECKAKGVALATAESCTGGMIAAALTDIAGSSAVVDRGFVTYSNAAKQEMLGVKAATLDAHGAVSLETAIEMADGALSHSNADAVIAVTGIAGPDGGTPEKPVGLVWFGIAVKGKVTKAESRIFSGLDRAGVRHETVAHALAMLRQAVA